MTTPELLEFDHKCPHFGHRSSPFSVSLCKHQSLSEPPIPLQMPFAAHRLFPRVVPLRIQQEPHAPARRPRARPRIMPGDPPLEIVGPADVRPISVDAATTDHVHEASHLFFLSKWKRSRGWVDHALHKPRRMKAEWYICYVRHRAAAPENNVARRARLCASHWVKGSP